MSVGHVLGGNFNFGVSGLFVTHRKVCVFFYYDNVTITRERKFARPITEY